MEKLIELLNECMVECGLSPAWVISGNGVRAKKSYYGEEISEMVIISKKYGFIKRLIENDKIDRERFGNSETKSSKYSDFELSYDTPREDYTNILLMELAIRDNPLSFILDILK